MWCNWHMQVDPGSHHEKLGTKPWRLLVLCSQLDITEDGRWTICLELFILTSWQGQSSFIRKNTVIERWNAALEVEKWNSLTQLVGKSKFPIDHWESKKGIFTPFPCHVVLKNVKSFMLSFFIAALFVISVFSIINFCQQQQKRWRPRHDGLFILKICIKWCNIDIYFNIVQLKVHCTLILWFMY